MENNGPDSAQEPRQDPGGISCALRDSRPLESHPEAAFRPAGRKILLDIPSLMDPQGSSSSTPDPARPTPKIPPGAFIPWGNSVPVDVFTQNSQISYFSIVLMEAEPGWAHPAAKFYI